MHAGRRKCGNRDVKYATWTLFLILINRHYCYYYFSKLQESVSFKSFLFFFILEFSMTAFSSLPPFVIFQYLTCRNLDGMYLGFLLSFVKLIWAEIQIGNVL
jgi:hypothetical protein